MNIIYHTVFRINTCVTNYPGNQIKADPYGSGSCEMWDPDPYPDLTVSWTKLSYRYLRYVSGQRQVQVGGWIHPQDGDERLVRELEPVGLAAERGVLEPGSLVLRRLQHQAPHLQDPLPVLHHPLAALPHKDTNLSAAFCAHKLGIFPRRIPNKHEYRYGFKSKITKNHHAFL